MSKVFSFRLDDTNPREAQAREVINAWVSNGYSQRHIIVEALISFCIGDEKGYELEKTIARFTTLVDKLETSTFISKTQLSSEESLSEEFLESIAISVKPGERINTKD